MQPAEWVGAKSAYPFGERPAGGAYGPVPVCALGSAGDHRHAGGIGERGGEFSSDVAINLAARQIGPHQRRQVGDEPVDVAGQALQQGQSGRHRTTQSGGELLGAGCGSGGRGQHRHAAQPIAGQQAAQVRDASLHIGRLEQVGLVEYHHGDVAMSMKLGQVPAVQYLVGILLRIQHPHDQIDQRQHPVDLDAMGVLDRVQVGQIQQHQAAQRLVAAVLAVAKGHTEPVQQFPGTGGPPHAGVHDSRCRPPNTYSGQFSSAQNVEQARLSAPGRSGECDHGVLAGQREALAGPADDRSRRHQQLIR